MNAVSIPICFRIHPLSNLPFGSQDTDYGRWDKPRAAFKILE
jgi:hypothetical protein